MFEHDTELQACLFAARNGDLMAVRSYFADHQAEIAVRNSSNRDMNLTCTSLSARDRFAPSYHWFDNYNIDYVLLSIVLDGGHVQVVQWLFDDEQLPLIGEILRGICNTSMNFLRRYMLTTSLEIVESMIESSLFKKVMDDQEQTNFLTRLLLMGTSRGKKSWVNALVAYGADPVGWYVSQELFPIDVVGYEGNVETLDLLLDHGVSILNACMESQIHQFIQNLDILGAMVRCGADANAVWCTGGTILHAAVIHGYREHVETLLDEGYADVDGRGSYGLTPLMRLGFMDDPGHTPA